MFGTLALSGPGLVRSPPADAARPAAATAPCRARPVDAVLPVWARAGFHPAATRMHFELGSRGEIAALLFAFPLLSPPSTVRANKILWVSRVATDGSPLVITARRMEGSEYTGAPVRRIVTGGPGPSIVDLPTPGCWRLDLAWSGHRDRLDVAFVAHTAD